MTKVKVLICPYCGETQPAGERCRKCGGVFESLSRQATLNAMGPWQIRDENRPFHPGCSYETLVQMIARGRVTKLSIIRGPTTKQLWQVARRVPGIAHHFGYCHHCDAHVDAKDLNCPQCRAAFGAYLDRNHLGLPDVNPLPWDVDEDDAASTGVFRQYFEPPRLQATSLSSFARDDELVESRERFRESDGGLLAALGGALASAETEEIGAEVGNAAVKSRIASPQAKASSREASSLAEALPEFGTYAASARQRSLERRVKQQTNLVRTLAVLFFIAVLFALALQFGWIGRSESQPAAPERDAASTAPDALPHAGSPSEVASGQSSLSVEQEETAEAGAASAQPNDETSQANAPARPERPKPYRAEYERAMMLIQRSSDAARDLDERIDDVTHAVQILRNIRDNAEPSLWPDGLELEIERQSRRIDELELSRFF